ncbi:MAG: metallophosphoesterase [Bacillota bacterium]|nr:metallophosphoesterase [Bacillota bacterium]
MLNILIGAVILLALFFIAVMAVDCNRFTIREYHCRSGSLKKGMKFVLLTDLHSKSFGRNNQKLLQAIEQIRPDMILIAGDMYTAGLGQTTEVAKELVCTLAARYPVYYGMGNHEYKTRAFPKEYGDVYEDYAKELGQAGVRLLINERACLSEDAVDIFGLDLGREYYRKFHRTRMEKSYLNGVLGRPDENRFSVLIAHNPDYFEDYAAWGADLVVSGHVHGGLMRLPVLGGVISPAMRLFPKYDGGIFKEGKSIMILSRGLGTHTLPIRIFNPGELVVIQVDCQNDPC